MCTSPDTGSPSPTAGSAARSARATAASPRARRASASSARTRAASSCRSPTGARPASRRSHREEAAQPLPAGHAGAVVRHRRLQPRLPVLPELGHLQVARGRPRSPRRRRRAGGRPRGARLAAASVAFTYNDPVIWAEYAIDVAEAATRAGIRTVCVTAGYVDARARARRSSRTWTPPTWTSRRSPRTSTAR